MARRDDEHPPYWECPDLDCPRFPCKIWKQGYAAGYQDGSAAGEITGYAEGYAAGAAAAARTGS